MAPKVKQEDEVALDDVLNDIEEEASEDEIDLKGDFEIDSEDNPIPLKVTELSIKDLEIDNLDRQKEEYSKSNPKMVLLVENIQARGLLNPILVHPIEDKPGKYRVIAGKRRTQAMKLLKKETISAIIHSYKTEGDFIGDAISDNAVHSEASKKKLSETVKSLLSDGTCKNQTEVAKLLGFSQGWVSALLNFANLPEEIKEAVSVDDAPNADEIEGKNIEEIKKEVSGKKFRPMPRDFFIDAKKPEEKVPVKIQVSGKVVRVTTEIPVTYLKEGTVTSFLTEQFTRIAEDEKKFILSIRKFRNQEFQTKKDGDAPAEKKSKKVAAKVEE